MVFIKRWRKLIALHKKCDNTFKAVAVLILIMMSIIATTIYYPGSIFKVTLNKRAQFDIVYVDSAEFVINTPGCQIPRYNIVWTEDFVASNTPVCGERAVHIQKLTEQSAVLKIDDELLQSYVKRGTFSHCCVSEVHRPNSSESHRDDALWFSDCIQFTKEIILEPASDFLKVECFQSYNNEYSEIYADALFWIHQKQAVANTEEDAWSVLIVGFDTMSRLRLRATMTSTYEFMLKKGWIDFKAFNKVGDNTFPNVFAMLTGMSTTDGKETCQLRPDICNDYFAWSQFSKCGYATAYGEDFLKLPDTFISYGGFQNPPTDHYMRPFYMLGEEEFPSSSAKVICRGKLSSGEQMLNYAEQFSTTYKNKKSFGVFWMNSNSHNEKYTLKYIDMHVKTFLQRLEKEGILQRTFIFLLSDHGVRFGPNRLHEGGFFLERLPSLMVWIPRDFRDQHPEKYDSAILNRNVLVNQYDLFMTFQDILHHNPSCTEVTTSKTCNNCESILNRISSNRTCSDIAIDEKYCACQVFIKANRSSKEVIAAVEHVFNIIVARSKLVKTFNCWKCAKFKMKSIDKAVYYMKNDIKYYVITFTLSPGTHVFDALVSFDGKQYTVDKSITTLSITAHTGRCCLRKGERTFCHCISAKCRGKG